MFALGHALMHQPSMQRNTPRPPPPTPVVENTPLTIASKPSTFAPDFPPLPTLSGIPPASVQYPKLAKLFNVGDQQAFIEQHDDLTLGMQRL